MLLSVRVGRAQEISQSDWFMRAAFTPAYVIPTNPYLSEVPPDQQVRWAPSTTIEIGRQTDGSREWHHLYGLPSYGFGVSLASLKQGGGVARPVDAYAFFSWPFARLNDRAQVTTDIGMGLSWNWKQVNPQTKAERNVLSSDMNARIDWGFYLHYTLTPQTSVYAGLDFTHRSNGGTQQPDEGINVIGPSIAVRYNLAPQRREFLARSRPPFRPSWEFLAGGSGGIKKVMDGSQPGVQHDVGVANTTAGVQRQFYRFGKVAMGADVTYDSATGSAISNGLAPGSRTTLGDQLRLGVFGGYEHIIGRFGALVQAGYRVAGGVDEPGRSRLYARYGWRLQVTDHLWGLVAVRAIEGRKAEFIEFGAGYQTGWR